MAEILKRVNGKTPGGLAYVEFEIEGKPRTTVVAQVCGKTEIGGKRGRVWCVFLVTSKTSRTYGSGTKKEAIKIAHAVIKGL
jgi:hypothetical protein